VECAGSDLDGERVARVVDESIMAFLVWSNLSRATTLRSRPKPD
jgi:hypothetical protein